MYASINVKPGGGGATQGICGAFDLYCSIAFPTIGNLTKSLGPGVGKFAFFVQRNGTKGHHPLYDCKQGWFRNGAIT